MLQIDHFTAAEEPEVEYDPYTPVTITWPRYRRVTGKLLTRVFGDTGNYLELKADPESGELLEVVLVSASARAEEDPAQLESRDAHEAVVPCFDLAAAGASLSPPTEQAELAVVAYPDLLEVRFPVAATALVGDGPVRFGVGDDGGLAALRLDWGAAERDSFLGDFAEGSAP